MPIGLPAAVAGGPSDGWMFTAPFVIQWTLGWRKHRKFNADLEFSLETGDDLQWAGCRESRLHSWKNWWDGHYWIICRTGNSSWDTSAS